MFTINCIIGRKGEVITQESICSSENDLPMTEYINAKVQGLFGAWDSVYVWEAKVICGTGKGYYILAWGAQGGDVGALQLVLA